MAPGPSVPTVEGWHLDLAARVWLPVFIAHGKADPVIEVGFARQARDLLAAAGLDVTYFESGAGHHLDRADIPAANDGLSEVLHLHI